MATFAAPPPQQRDWRELPDAKTIDTGTKRLVVFLDYDGTLTPIVEASDAAVLAAPMRAAIARLARHAPVAVVSGRAREKVREFVAVENLYYAGSHGFDIDGPGGLRHSVSAEIIPVLAAARDALRRSLAHVAGASVEDNRFAVSVHWRNVADAERPAVSAVVDAMLREAPFAGALKRSEGKCVYELKPNVRWDKGEAVLYLLELLRRALDLDSAQSVEGDGREDQTAGARGPVRAVPKDRIDD